MTLVNSLNKSLSVVIISFGLFLNQGELEPDKISISAFISKIFSKLKSVQSARSGPRGTFFRLSTMRGCISIIELLQFTIVRSFWQI